MDIGVSAARFAQPISPFLCSTAETLPISKASLIMRAQLTIIVPETPKEAPAGNGNTPKPLGFGDLRACVKAYKQAHGVSVR
jgi:hypothetical protein